MFYAYVDGSKIDVEFASYEAEVLDYVSGYTPDGVAECVNKTVIREGWLTVDPEDPDFGELVSADLVCCAETQQQVSEVGFLAQFDLWTPSQLAGKCAEESARWFVRLLDEADSSASLLEAAQEVCASPEDFDDDLEFVAERIIAAWKSGDRSSKDIRRRGFYTRGERSAFDRFLHDFESCKKAAKEKEKTAFRSESPFAALAAMSK